jgi:hypothetical protein
LLLELMVLAYTPYARCLLRLLALETGHMEEAHNNMLLEDSKTTTSTMMLSTPAKNVRVKNVKDARKLQRVLDQITVVTSREELVNEAPGVSWCTNFQNYPSGSFDDIPLSTTPVDVFSLYGDRVFSVKSDIDDPFWEGIINYFSGIIEYHTNTTLMPLGDLSLTLDHYQDITAWGGDFTLILPFNRSDPVDLELEIECNSGTITLPVESAKVDDNECLEGHVDDGIDGCTFFFGFRIFDDVVSSIKLKSRNDKQYDDKTFTLHHVCASVPGWTVSCEQEKINCDFSALTPNAFDNQALLDSCGISANATYATYDGDRINVFDSSNILSQDDDPDLGSPNRKCSPAGPGKGRGGNPNAAFPNCEPLGNLLILQNHNITDRPNDSPERGCITFDFVNRDTSYEQEPVLIKDFGLLDIEEGAGIYVRMKKKKPS